MKKTVARAFARISAFVLSIVLMALCMTVAVAGTMRIRDGRWKLPDRGDIQRIVRVVRQEPPRPSKTVVLERRALTVVGGDNNSSALTTSLLPAGQARNIPA